MSIPPPTLRAEPDGTLVLHKPKPGGGNTADLLVLVDGSVFIGGLLIALPFTPEGPASRAGAVVLIGLGLAILVFGLRGAVRYYRRIELGEWRIDGVGIEFRASKGTDRRLAWGEINRVFWGDGSFHLVGATSRIRLIRDLLPEADWQTLRGRIEAELSPRFDLAPRPPRPAVAEFRLGRVVRATVPLGAVWLGYTYLIAPRQSPRQVSVGMMVLLLLTSGVIFRAIWRYRRSAGPVPSAWRYPRPTPAEENGPMPEVGA